MAGEHASTTTRKTNIIIAAALGALLSLFVGGGSASAQEEAATDESQEAATSYTYTVEECDTVTHLARRSVQIEDVSNGEISLSNAAKVYAETVLAQKIENADMIAIGQMITFDAADVKSVVADANNLSADELANWEMYAANVEFETINNIAPTQTPPGVTVPSSSQEAEQQSEQREEEAAADDNSEEEQAEQNENEGALDDNTTPWYWWVVGAGAIGGVWYLLWNRAEQE